jgi:hypothetical protein
MRKAVIAFMSVWLCPVSGLWTQESLPVAPGTRVRVTAPSLGVYRQAATLEAAGGGVLTVSADSTVQYPLSAVALLEVYSGRSHPWRGAGIGFLAGYAAGFLVWLTAVGGCYEGATTTSCAAVLGGSSGAVFGTLTGALVGGFLWRTDKWDEVPLRDTRVHLAPQQNGFSLGLSLRF